MWISVKHAAELLNLTDRAVRLNCEKKKYICRCKEGVGRGGIQLEVLLESLPPIAIKRYTGEEQDVLSKYLERPEGCSGIQWHAAEDKARIVDEYKTSNMTLADFLVWYNENYAPKKPITRQTLLTWQRKLKKGGLAALVDTRGGMTSGVAISDEIWDFFYSVYMTQQKRTVKLCYDITKKHFPDTPFPSVSSFERRVKDIPKYALLYYREGEKAFKDALPYMERDKSSINSNDVWFSDHHTLDLFAKTNNGKGKPFRPTLTVFFDARSNKVISFVIRREPPNSVVVKKCLKLGIEAYGVPKEVYFDNGKDYRSNQFKEEYPYSITRMLGINTIHATAYHGQAKTCERFFRIVTERFAKLFDTYCGSDNKKRPEKMRISDKRIMLIAPTLEQVQNAFINWVKEYNATPSDGGFMDGNCPNEVYSDNLKLKVKVKQDALDMLFATVHERTVHKNGVSLWNNNYYNSALVPYFGKKVIVRNYPENIDKVYIFDMEDKYICNAAARTVSAYRSTSEADYAEAKREQRAVRKEVKKYSPKRNLGVHELIVTNQANELSDRHETAATNETELINLPVEKVVANLKEGGEKQAQKTQKPSLSVIMNEYYNKLKEEA